MIERIKIMFIKLLIGPAASGKSTYIENHKSENDIIDLFNEYEAQLGSRAL